MARAIDSSETHVRYLVATAKSGGVRLACTCGVGGHAARSWRSFDSAVAELKADGFDFSLWINDPMVSRICRDYAEQGTGVETLRGLLSLKL